MSIIAKFNLEGKAVIGKHNQDFYRVSVNEKDSLLKLISLIKPHIKHTKRYRDMINCEKNIIAVCWDCWNDSSSYQYSQC